MVRKYRNESKHRINGRENTGTKVNITLMVWKYRNESKFHTNGRENKGTYDTYFYSCISLPLE
jgi:hypothetical protein